jgi:hypothetical protein
MLFTSVATQTTEQAFRRVRLVPAIVSTSDVRVPEIEVSERIEAEAVMGRSHGAAV